MNRLRNFDKYTAFRDTYQVFSFDSYDFQVNNNIIHAKFCFSIDEKIHFQPETSFNIPGVLRNFSSDALETLIFHVGMVELISYWKSVCPEKVVIRPFFLNPEQLKWWKKLWFNGLGEFFWLNSIEATQDDFLEVVCVNEKAPPPVRFADIREGIIVPVGGGKDSVVSLEFLRQMGQDVFPMMVNPREAQYQTLKAAGISLSGAFVAQREIHPVLLEMNAQGCLNGHTPFSSLLAFQSLLFSLVSGIPFIALSNESSANESTVPGTNVNHQYSKSYEFELDFRHYVHQYLNPEFQYFSLLRPLSELQIAFAFSRFEQHIDVFRSCNAGSKQNVWCGKCPKCLFTAVILLPFTGPEKLFGIFGKDMFDDISLIPVLKQLTGIDPVKPFECVGTPDEINTALSYAVDNWYSVKNLPVLLDFFRKSHKYRPVSSEELTHILTEQFDNRHFLKPAMYEQLLGFIRADSF